MSELRSARGRRTTLTMFLIRALSGAEAGGGFYNCEFTLGSGSVKDYIWMKDLSSGEVIEVSVTVREGGIE